MTHQLATGRTATLIKLAFAAGAKVSAAFAAFALTALVTRNMPNDEAGLFLLGFTLLAVLSIFFRLGLDNVILRFLSAHGTDDFAQEKLNRGLLWVASATIPATILGMALSEPIATQVFSKPNFAPILFWMLPALPAMALFFLLSFAFQAQHRVVITTLFQNLGISTLFIAGLGYLWFNQPEEMNAVAAAKVYALAGVAIFFIAILLWFSKKNVRFTLKGYKDSELTHASMNLWSASAMSLAVQWAGVLFAGAFLAADSVAEVNAAQRTANLISFVLVVVNMVVAPRYARYWRDGDLLRLQQLAHKASRLAILLALPAIVSVFLFDEEIMGMFGDGYESAGLLLTIFGIGHAINVSTGSVGYLLNMSGHEREFRKVTIYSGVFAVVIAFILVKYYGPIGAAVATAISSSLQNIIAFGVVKRKLGFWPVG